MTQVTLGQPRALSSHRSAKLRYTVLLLFIAGVALRIWAYASNPPLWLDEILLSRNIIDLPLSALLTEPLGLDQVAPRGFLLVERWAILLLGPSELALRLMPLLCGLAGLFLFWRLAQALLDQPTAVIALGLVALAVPFAKFGAEVKQYIFDATIATLLLWLAVQLRRQDASHGRLLAAGATGFIVSWFSQTSAIVMTAIGVTFAITWLIERDRRSRRVLLFTMPIWAASAALAVVLGSRSMTPSTREFMQSFWAAGFFPWPIDSGSDALWFWESANSLFADPTLLRYRWPSLFILLAAAGVGALWKRDRFAALLVVSPVLTVMAAAVAQQYPFFGRLLMFLLPSTMLAVAAGINAVRTLMSRLHPSLGAAALVACLISPALAIAHALPPYDLERTGEMLAYLQRHRQPGDVIYAWPITRVGLLTYGPQFGITPEMWITADCHREDVRGYLRNLDAFRGKPRVWTIGPDARVFRAARAATARYLETIGTRLDTFARPSMTFGEVRLDLYDLSDPAKLQAADAETIPVEPISPRARPGCRDWTRHNAPLTVR